MYLRVNEQRYAAPLIFIVGISFAALVLFLMKKYFKIGTITRPLAVSVMFLLVLFMNIGFIINDYFSYTGVESKSLVGIVFPVVLAFVFYRWHIKTLAEK